MFGQSENCLLLGLRLKNLQEKPGVVNQPFLWSPVLDPYVLEKGIFGKDDWKTVWLLSNVENNPGDHFSFGGCVRVLGDIGANIRSGFGKGFTNPADLRKIHQVPAPFLFFFVAKPRECTILRLKAKLTSEFLQFRPLDHWVNQSPFHESNFESPLEKQQIYPSGTFGVAQYFGEPQCCYQHSNQTLVKGALFSLWRTFRWLVGRQLSALLVSARSLGGHQLLYAPGF